MKRKAPGSSVAGSALGTATAAVSLEDEPEGAPGPRKPAVSSEAAPAAAEAAAAARRRRGAQHAPPPEPHSAEEFLAFLAEILQKLRQAKRLRGDRFREVVLYQAPMEDVFKAYEGALAEAYAKHKLAPLAAGHPHRQLPLAGFMRIIKDSGILGDTPLLSANDVQMVTAGRFVRLRIAALTFSYLNKPLNFFVNTNPVTERLRIGGAPAGLYGVTDGGGD